MAAAPDGNVFACTRCDNTQPTETRQAQSQLNQQRNTGKVARPSLLLGSFRLARHCRMCTPTKTQPRRWLLSKLPSCATPIEVHYIVRPCLQPSWLNLVLDTDSGSDDWSEDEDSHGAGPPPPPQLGRLSLGVLHVFWSLMFPYGRRGGRPNRQCTCASSVFTCDFCKAQGGDCCSPTPYKTLRPGLVLIND